MRNPRHHRLLHRKRLQRVIPANANANAKAKAKISFCLVAGQDPKKILATFCTHVRAPFPADCSICPIDHGASFATVMPVNGMFLQKALGALTEE